MKSTFRTVSVSALVLAAALTAGCGNEGGTEEARTEAPAAVEPATTATEPAMAESESAMETDMAEASMDEEEPEMAAPAEEAEMDAEMMEASAEEDSGEMEMAQASASGELPADHPALGGDPAAGKRVFIKCMSCHAVKEGQNKVGPSLYGIVGRPAGSVEGFNYSEANAESGIVWTKDVMFEYLEDPQGYIPGTKMIFPGLPSEQERRDVIAYLDSVAE